MYTNLFKIMFDKESFLSVSIWILLSGKAKDDITFTINGESFIELKIDILLFELDNLAVLPNKEILKDSFYKRDGYIMFDKFRLFLSSSPLLLKLKMRLRAIKYHFDES